MAAAAASGLLLALAQPPVAAWPLAFVWLVPLLAVLGGRTLPKRVWLSGLCGVTFALCVAVGPTGLAASRFLGVPLWQGLTLTTLTGIVFGGLSFALLGLLAGDPRRQPLPLFVARAGAAFAVAELARGRLLTGIPWLLLSHALAPRPELAQLAAWGGSALLGAWVAGVNAALAGLLRPAARRAVAPTLLGLAALAAAAALAMPGPGQPGSVQPVQAPEGPTPPGALRVALVQPALAEEIWNDGSRAAASLDPLVRLSREAGPSDLLVWPEYAFKPLLPANRALLERALGGLDGAADAVLLGAPRYDPARPERQFNSAQLLAADGRVLGVHDKVRLVPFFEYPVLGRGSHHAVLTSGGEAQALSLDGHRIGALICYEVLFSRIARDEVARGAELLLNLSNDAWFGGSGGAEQHFAAAVLLAIELRRPVLRSTPTGVTGAIDAAGRVAARLPADRPGAVRVDVWPSRERSGYARLGDAFAGLALVFCGLLTLADARRRG
jgi:apolipoprotein N-acyltransferase